GDDRPSAYGIPFSLSARSPRPASPRRGAGPKQFAVQTEGRWSCRLPVHLLQERLAWAGPDVLPAGNPLGILIALSLARSVTTALPFLPVAIVRKRTNHLPRPDLHPMATGHELP